MSLCASATLYQECCALCGVKPNKDILRQVEHPAFLSLKSINVSRTFLGELGVRALFNFVSQHACIQSLILVKNAVDASCVEQLCALLRNGHPSLSYIDLSENPLSTPSARLIWDAVKEVPTVRTIKMDHCGVSEEWLNRVERCCKANDELQRVGFFPYGPERSLQAWETVFILVLGCPKAVQLYCTKILPPVSSFISKLRIRIAPITVDPDDSDEVVKNKVRRCAVQRNYHLTWCVALLVGDEKWSASMLTALEVVACQERPLVPPLRNKLGVLRDPVQKCAQDLFVYDLTRFYQPVESTSWSISPGKWLQVIGMDTLIESKRFPSAVLLSSDSNFHVRCQSDLFIALNTVFNEAPRPINLFSDEEKSEIEKYMWESIGRDMHLGPFFPKLKEVQQYVESPPGPLTVPLMLYGAGGLGKASILSWIATTYRTVESFRVVPYRLSYDNRSLVVMLFYLLRIFDKGNVKLFYTVEELVMAVQMAISKYDGVPILLLVSSLENLESVGIRQSMILEWLPSSLPPSVKVVLTVNTESPFLSFLRKRQPQPYEILIASLPTQLKVGLFVEELRRWNVILSPGREENANETSDSGELDVSYKAVEGVFFQKEGFEFICFTKYTAAFLHDLIHGNMSDGDIAFLIAQNIPDSLQDLLILLLKRYELLHGAENVRYALLCLAAAPIPLNELIYICEELGPCTRNHTVQLVFLMCEDGVVTCSADSVLYLANMGVRRTVAAFYAEAWDTVSVLMETHLYRLVMTQSPDMSICFQNLVPLIMENGNFGVMSSLMLNAKTMDALLGRSRENRIYVVDALFRLLYTPEFLIELGENISSLSKEISFPSRSALRYALRSIQSYRSLFFQEVLLMTDVSPYHTDAVGTKEVPSAVLFPLNRGVEENAMYSLQCKHKLLFLHSRGEHIVVTTSQDVTVYSASDNYKVVNSMFCELSNGFLGALMATGTRVVVISAEQIHLWDFTGQSFTLLSDMTAALSSNALDVVGLNLLVRHPSRETISIVDVVKKKETVELPLVREIVRECVFSGSSVLVRSVYDLFIIRGSDVMKLPHNGFIRCFATSADGQLIASSVKENLWVWSGSGELLHHMDAGLTPLERLQFNSSGSLLLSLQNEGLKIWNSTLGICMSTLDKCFEDDTSFVCFSEDGSRVIGRCGTRICSWDSHRPYKPQGAFTCSNGHFTFLQESNQTIFALTSKDEVKIWNYGNIPFPSIQSSRENIVTTMWRKNAKLSYTSINCIDINAAGTHFVVVDAAGTLMMVCFERGDIHKFDVANVQSAVIIDDTIVFTTSDSEDCIYFTRLNVNGSVPKSVKLPRDVQVGATLQLLKNEHGNKIAVISNGVNWSTIYTYDLLDENWTNRFLGHSGRITHAFFSGEFLTSSAEDCTLRLWSLVRHAERSSYLHNCQICAMTKSEKFATLYFFDESSRLFNVYVDDITSPVHARFVAAEVELAMTIPKGVKARYMAFSSDIIIMSSWDGSVYLVDNRHGGSVGRLPDYQCVCVAVNCIGSDTFVLTTHTTGDVILHNVLLDV